VFDPISDAVQSRGMEDRAWSDCGPANGKMTISDFSDPSAKRRGAESWEIAQYGAKECFRSTGSVDIQVRSLADVTRVEHGVEEKRDEIREVIRMEVCEQDVTDPMPVDPCLHEVRKGSGAEIKQKQLIGLNQITSSRAGGVDIRTRAENGKAHHRCE
jgi:hypothetical protein